MVTTITGESIGAHYGEGAVTAIVVAAGANSVVRTIEIPIGARRLFFQISNASVVAFDQFTIQRRPHASAAWESLPATAGDYATPVTPLLEVQGAPVTLGALAICFIRMDVIAAESVRLLASSGGAASAANLWYRIQ